MKIKGIKVWGVRGPFVFSDEITAVGGNPVLSQLCCVRRRAVLLEDKTGR